MIGWENKWEGKKARARKGGGKREGWLAFRMYLEVVFPFGWFASGLSLFARSLMVIVRSEHRKAQQVHDLPENFHRNCVY